MIHIHQSTNYLKLEFQPLNNSKNTNNNNATTNSSNNNNNNEQNQTKLVEDHMTNDLLW